MVQAVITCCVFVSPFFVSVFLYHFVSPCYVIFFHLLLNFDTPLRKITVEYGYTYSFFFVIFGGFMFI